VSLRRTPLSRGASHDEQGRKRYTSFSGPRKPLARSRMKRALPKRIKRRADASPYVQYVRTLACVHCHKSGPSTAAHVATGPGQKGMSLKVPDWQCVPLCDGPRSCHRYFDGQEDGPKNPFRGWSKEEKWAVAADWVALTKMRATRPRTVADAYKLADAGLGEVLRQVAGAGWAVRSVVLP